MRPGFAAVLGEARVGAVGLDAADREDALRQVEGQQSADEFGGGGYGVAQLIAQCGVAPCAVYGEAQFVARSHVFARAESEGAHFERRFDVLAYHGPHVVVGERLFGQHQRRASGVALLARLEESEKRPLEVARTIELLQDTHQHGRVDVVAAGVHHPVVERAPRHVGLFADRQRVDVGAQDDRTTKIAAAFDACQDARAGDGAVGDAQPVERAGDEVVRPGLAEREFGTAVQRTAESDDVELVGHGQNTSLMIWRTFSARPMV